MSLFEIGRKCLQALHTARFRLDDRVEEQQRIENVLDRLNVWKGSIGFTAKGSASIDRRFRDDRESKDVLHTMLERLWLGSQLLLSAVDGQEPEVSCGASRQESVVETIPTHDNREPQDTLMVEDKEQFEHTTDSDLAQSTLVTCDQAFDRIEETITLLFRFLNLMRQNHSQPNTARVLAFRKKHGSHEDDAEFENFLRWYIEKNYPGLHESKKLTSRMVNIALYRRWNMMYRRRHAQKLAYSGSWDDVEFQAFPRLQRPDLSSTNLEASRSRDTSGKNEQALEIDGNAARGPAYSDTEPSIIRNVTTPQLATRREPSIVSRSGLTRRSQLQIPRAPQPTAIDSLEAICTYCWTIIGPDLYGEDAAAKNRWR